MKNFKKMRLLVLAAVLSAVPSVKSDDALDKPKAAAGEGKIDAAQLKPEVLYIDLANPTNVRGITLDEKQAGDLGRVELDGIPSAEPRNGKLNVKLDPTVVEGTPMLVVLNYYDCGTTEDAQWNRWDKKIDEYSGNNRILSYVQGFLNKPDPKYFYSSIGISRTFELGWRWWTTFTYANATLFPQKIKQASFYYRTRYPRWILVLPMNEERMKEMNDIREKVLAMMADYSRLIIAETALQDAKGRLEQAMKYQAEGEARPPLSDVFGKVKAGAWQARLDMNDMNMAVVKANEQAYLGMFDGKLEHLQMLEAFRKKTVGFLESYRALMAQAEKCLSGEVDAQCVKYGLTKVSLTAPARFAPDRVVKPEDLRSRFFIGSIFQNLQHLPQSSIDTIVKDQGVDSVFPSYSASNCIKPQEDGSYDFSDLDETLGTMRGIRVELGMHNIPLPPWAQKKFLGEKPEKTSGGWCRVKSVDGQWDGIYAGADDFTPAGNVWSETLFRYSCDFYRAVGKHYRDNPLILRYTLNSENSTTASAASGYIFDAALPYYRAHLKKKFDDIQKLNRVCGTDYKNFEELLLPKSNFYLNGTTDSTGNNANEGTPGKEARLTPALYEYIQLCIERTKFVREEFARALRETDPNHAIGEVQSSMFGGNVMDTYAMAVNTPFDTFAAGDSDTRSCRYQYSYNRYHPRPIWMYEPYEGSGWTAPDGKGDYRSEEARRRMLATNLWRWFFWGHQGLPMFNSIGLGCVWTRDYRLADIMLYPGQGLTSFSGTYPSVNLAAGCIGNLKSIFDRLEGILQSAPVIPARIGLLESSTTHRVPWPASGTFADIGQLQGRLGQEGKHFFFVPETALVEGAEQINDYRIIIAAYATHLRPEARDALLEWVKRGGVLICSGPTGLYDHYGRSEGGLPETVFGMKGVEYGVGITEDSKVTKSSGTMVGREGISLFANKDFYWRLPSKGLAEGTRVLAALADDTPVVVERTYGKGKVILTTAAMGSQLDLYWPMVMAEINQVQPVPEAVSSDGSIGLQVRESKDSIRYLSAVNGNISGATEATITVAGEFEHPRDLTVGNGWVIPAVAGGGVTRFKIWMGQGMGSFIELGKSRTKLSGLSPEEENANLAIGRFTNLMRRAAASGLDISLEEKKLKDVEKECAAKQYEKARKSLKEMTTTLGTRWFGVRAEKVATRAGAAGTDPLAGTWARSYAAIAQQLLKDGKQESAEERMELAEKTLGETPTVYPAEMAFPFVSGQLDLKDLSSWPKEGWQTVYQNRKEKAGELGQFILVGSADGIYLGAKVKSEKVTDKAQKPGLPWRVMDGVVLHLRGLDRTEALSNEWKTEDSYEITFYADGSLFVWDNLLPCDEKLIRNEVTRVKDGYMVGGFIPAEAIRFWPRAGVNVITDACVFTYGQKENTDGYWHGTYGQANTWARVRLGEDKAEGRGLKAEGGGTAPLPKNTAEACLRVEHWMPQETRGVGRAAIAFDAAETLPNGKKGAIALTSDGQMEEIQLMTQFEEIGKRTGLRVWLKGTGSDAKIALRVTGREGSTWQMIVKDDSKDWRTVDVVLDKCQQTTEDIHNEVLNKFEVYRPRLNRLIVRFAKPLSTINVGLIEYLTNEAK